MKKQWIGYVIGAIVFTFILTRINIAETFEIITSANLIFVAGSILLLVPMVLLEAARWQYIMRNLGMKYPFGESLIMFASSLFIGFVTPARIGEFVRVTFLKSHATGKSFFSIFADRLADVMFLLAAGYIGMFFFARQLSAQIIWLSLSIVGFVLLCAIAIIKRDLLKALMRLAFYRAVPEKFRKDLRTAFYDFYSGFPKILGFMSIIVISLLTLFAWILYYAQVYLLAKSLGIEISFIHLATIVSVAGLLSLIPITISGIGTRDAAFVFFFTLLGIRSEFAVALSAMVLFLTVASAILCLPFWIRKPADLSFLEGK